MKSQITPLWSKLRSSYRDNSTTCGVCDVYFWKHHYEINMNLTLLYTKMKTGATTKTVEWKITVMVSVNC